MSSRPEDRSPLVRFLDAFLKDENITWMLGVGVMVLLGSSLRLVTVHWHEYTPVWKYCILLAYTGVVFVSGEVAYRNLALRRTGTFLKALTVLLIPLTFLALHWIQPAGSPSLLDLLSQGGLLLLLCTNLILSAWGAERIFRHFFRKSQPTFLASYLILGLAGAIVPGLPAAWSPMMAALLWVVFTAGTIKVNRHIFWLTEEYRLPRICGFFPIALLGGQYLTLFVLGFARNIELPWLGLACVLIAVPILLTADTVAKVFAQRNGNLVRPLPWSIVLPLLVGVALCAGGVCLAGTRWPAHAMVPTAALAAFCMGVIARRTEHKGFVWAMLFGIVMSYQCSPAFFLDFARMVVQQGAHAVHEPRLPFAFYGLTYLPLIGTMSVAATLLRRRGEKVFSGPIRAFTIALPCLLLAVSFTNLKAIFPVACVLTAPFAAQTLCYRERRLMILAIGSFVAAAYGFTPFAVTVLHWTLPTEMPVIAFLGVAAVLLCPGWLLDRLSLRLVPGDANGELARANAPAYCQLSSLALTLPIAGYWLIHVVATLATPAPLVISGCITMLLLVQTIVWLLPCFGELALMFVAAIAGIHMFGVSVEPRQIIAYETYWFLAQWAAGSALECFPRRRLARAFAGPLHRVSLAGLVFVLMTYVLPQLLAVHFGELDTPWTVIGCVVAWSFDAARRCRSQLAAALGCVAVLLASSAGLLTAGGVSSQQWLLATWASVAVLAIPLWKWLHERSCAYIPAEPGMQYGGVPLASTLERMIPAVLLCVATVSLWFLTVPPRTGALIALGGLFVMSRLRGFTVVRQITATLTNWQLLTGLMTCCVMWSSCCGVPPMVLGGLTPAHFTSFGLPVALATALSLLLLDMNWSKRLFPDGELTTAHRGALWAVAGIMLVATLEYPRPGLTPFEIVLASATFGCLSLVHVLSACRKQHVESVWVAQGIVAAGIGYFALFGLFDIRTGLSLYATLLGGLALWTAGRLAERNPKTQILTGPFLATGYWLPLVTVFLGVIRHLTYADPDWKGLNSLALLAAAAFYFWQGLERSRPRHFTLAAIIVNVSLAMVWHELAWSDPQLFMIPIGASVLLLTEALKREIPAEAHNPLRYLGALVILVSPTFEIVHGSWIHLLTLMLSSVSITLVAMGLRVRALMYTGTAFLVADLLAMLVRSSVDRPNILWVAGMLLGGAVIALAAFCENHREMLLARLRLVAAQLEAWE